MSSRVVAYPGIEIAPEEVGNHLYESYSANLGYAWTCGVGMGKYLAGLKQGRIVGRRCNRCSRVLVPPRMYCERCFRPTDEWVSLSGAGRVSTYSVSHVNFDASRRSDPVIIAVVSIDGASGGAGILHLLGEVEPGQVKVGMKVTPVWRDAKDRVGSIEDIMYFRPA